MHDLRRGLVLDLTPVATERVDGAPDTTGRYRYADTARLGLDAHYGVTPNLSLDGTYKPDFSQVEADVGQVTLNQRFALFYPEKRPFFLDGLELFDTPNQLIYTRQIVNPDWGAKLAGQGGPLDHRGHRRRRRHVAIGSPATIRCSASRRIKYDLGPLSNLGLVATTRNDGSDFSRLAGADLHVVHSRLYYVELQGVASWTRDSSGMHRGTLMQAVWDRTGTNWGFHLTGEAVAPDFQAAAGFVNRTGIVDLSYFNRFTGYGSRGRAGRDLVRLPALRPAVEVRRLRPAGAVRGERELHLPGDAARLVATQPELRPPVLRLRRRLGRLPGADRTARTASPPHPPGPSPSPTRFRRP